MVLDLAALHCKVKNHIQTHNYHSTRLKGKEIYEVGLTDYVPLKGSTACWDLVGQFFGTFCILFFPFGCPERWLSRGFLRKHLDRKCYRQPGGWKYALVVSSLCFLQLDPNWACWPSLALFVVILAEIIDHHKMRYQRVWNVVTSATLKTHMIRPWYR